MYEVSEKFKKAIKASMRKGTITGTLTTSKGVEYELNDSAFIKDSFYISNRCVNGSALEFGCVYAAECGFSLVTDIDRNTLFDSKIVLQYNLLLEDNTVESIPLGEYHVYSSTRQGALINIKALDNMSKFDKYVESDTNGLWLDMVKYVANECGVELVQTDEELVALHKNTEYSYSIRTDRTDNYRDALAYLAMVVCCFATIDRSGKLKFVQFTDKVADTNDVNSRLNGCKFDDYITKFNGVVARFIAEENFYPYKAVDDKIKDALILDMGDIPIVGGTPSMKQNIVNSILATVKSIVYTPAKIYMPSNPALELGDFIQCDNVNLSTASIKTYVMNYKFEYRQKESIQCYGENPRLQSVKEKNKKILNSISEQMSKKDVVTISYTNAKAYEIKQDPKSIIEMKFSTFEECKPIFIATIPFSMDVDGYVEIQLYDGLIPIEDALYKGYYVAGEHFASIMFALTGGKDKIIALRVFCKVYADVNSEVRKINANIISFKNAFSSLHLNADGTIDATIEDVEPSTKEPTCNIGIKQIKSVVYTQGINKDVGGAWDGTLEFTEEINDILINSININSFDTSLEFEHRIPIPALLTETLAPIKLSNVIIAGIDDVEVDALSNYTWNELASKTWDELKKYKWAKN